jgi:hypothetical protein
MSYADKHTLSIRGFHSGHVWPARYCYHCPGLCGEGGQKLKNLATPGRTPIMPRLA